MRVGEAHALGDVLWEMVGDGELMIERPSYRLAHEAVVAPTGVGELTDSDEDVGGAEEGRDRS